MKPIKTIIACVLTVGTVLVVSPAAHAEELTPPAVEEVTEVPVEAPPVEEPIVIPAEPTVNETPVLEPPAVETPAESVPDVVSAEEAPADTLIQPFSLEEPSVSGVTQMQWADFPNSSMFQVTWNPPTDSMGDFYMQNVTYDYVIHDANNNVVLSDSSSNPYVLLPYSSAPSFSVVTLTVTPHVLIDEVTYAGPAASTNYTINKGVPSITVNNPNLSVDYFDQILGYTFNLTGSNGNNAATIQTEIIMNGAVVDARSYGNLTATNVNETFSLADIAYGEGVISVYATNAFGESNRVNLPFTYEDRSPDALTNTNILRLPGNFVRLTGTANNAEQVHYSVAGDDGSLLEGFEYVPGSFEYSIAVALDYGVNYTISLTPRSVYNTTGPVHVEEFYMPQESLSVPPIAEIQKTDPTAGAFTIVWGEDRGNITEADSILVEVNGEANVIPLTDTASSFVSELDNGNILDVTVQYVIANEYSQTIAESAEFEIDFRDVRHSGESLNEMIQSSTKLVATVDNGTATVAPLNGWHATALYDQRTGALVNNGGWSLLGGSHSFDVSFLEVNTDYVAVYRTLDGDYVTAAFVLADVPGDNGGGDGGGTPPGNGNPDDELEWHNSDDDAVVVTKDTFKTDSHTATEVTHTATLQNTGSDANQSAFILGAVASLLGVGAVTVSYVRRKVS